MQIDPCTTRYGGIDSAVIRQYRLKCSQDGHRMSMYKMSLPHTQVVSSMIRWGSSTSQECATPSELRSHGVKSYQLMNTSLFAGLSRSMYKSLTHQCSTANVLQDIKKTVVTINRVINN